MTKTIAKNISSKEDKITINNRLVDELLSQADHSELFEKDGLFKL